MTEIYKYFNYKVKGYWMEPKFLSVPQIRSILKSLWQYEVFATIQAYAHDRKPIYCPIYADLDHLDDKVIINDARTFVLACEFMINTTPRIYFSGNRGFHMIIDYKIEHEDCHLLAKGFIKETANIVKSIDYQVYRTNAMFRIPGSIGSTHEYYKIELTRDELFTLDMKAIKELALNQRFIKVDIDLEKMDKQLLEDWYKIEVSKLPIYNPNNILDKIDYDFKDEFTPCLKKLLSEPPEVGQRNRIVYILTKFFKKCNLSEQEALKLFLNYQHWIDFDLKNEVTKVVKSVYRSSKPLYIGCKTGTDAELMRQHCDKMCSYRNDYHIELNLFKRT